MHEPLQHLFREIERQRQTVLTSLRHLSNEQLNRVASPGTWSIAEIVSHLITAERMSVQYMQKKIHGLEQVSDTGIWEEAKSLLLIISQRLPGIKFKAPQRIVESTVQFKELAALEKEWETVRHELQALLETFPSARLKRKIYRHPFAGYLNIWHGLIFLREHTIHHTPQIKRLLPSR